MAPSEDLTIVNVHTPTSSFAIPFSYAQETLQSLFSKLNKKAANTGEIYGPLDHVGPGWVKYEWNDNTWNLDDDSDYTILSWRNKSMSPNPSSSTIPPDYCNPAFYTYRRPSTLLSISQPMDGARSIRSGRSKKSTRSGRNFHNGNGVRTVMGSIGPIKDVRMLLKSGYRHVYISRAFAKRHGFIPKDAQPGLYGYGGLVNIGKWPIVVGKTKTTHSVYLTEETHFDCILGRSFMELRGIKFDQTDPTNVVCLDTGEKLDCELVIIRDGNGEIVTVT
ncbi:hypothetical protein PNOK_0068500 [Pyrrhoderma noxium]|uniref:Uncharacterized protein n=1 Tax=Pyrrhoderma noxium TaxID=2282107 RepID=A0A286UVK7_9AGAM|nr:hypothetical protein PNOK_0068500 [Pyrrhoderma noxium]